MNHSIRRLCFLMIASTVLSGAGCASGSRKADVSDTDRARLLVNLANGAIGEGDPTGALQTLVEAEALDPRLPELHHSKALAFHAKRDAESAVAEARKAVEIKPNYAEANNTLGKLLLDGNRFAEAEKYLLVAARDPLYREAFKAQTNLGILYYRTGKDPAAAEFFGKAASAAPTQACIANYYLGHLALKSGNFQNAVTQYERATQRFCAGFADAHLALGMAYERNQQYDRARKKFLDIRQTFPNTQVAEKAMDRMKYLP